MINRSIVNIWRDCCDDPSDGKPSGAFFDDLVHERWKRIRTQTRLKPIYELDPADFCDLVVLHKIDHYRAYGFDGFAYDFDDMPEARRQIFDHIRSGYAMVPEALMGGSIDYIAREITRQIEAALDDELWEAA